MQLQKELRTHNLPKDSTHVYYLHTKYELQTPTGSGRTRIRVFLRVFGLRWFIKETLSKLLCESLNFEHKNLKLQPTGFLWPSGRIDSVFQFCPPAAIHEVLACIVLRASPARKYANLATFRSDFQLQNVAISRCLVHDYNVMPYWDQSHTTPKTSLNTTRHVYNHWTLL